MPAFLLWCILRCSEIEAALVRSFFVNTRRRYNIRLCFEAACGMMFCRPRTLSLIPRGREAGGGGRFFSRPLSQRRAGWGMGQAGVAGRGENFSSVPSIAPCPLLVRPLVPSSVSLLTAHGAWHGSACCHSHHKNDIYQLLVRKLSAQKPSANPEPLVPELAVVAHHPRPRLHAMIFVQRRRAIPPGGAVWTNIIFLPTILRYLKERDGDISMEVRWYGGLCSCLDQPPGDPSLLLSLDMIRHHQEDATRNRYTLWWAAGCL